MARTKTSKAWMHEHVTDVYVRRAKQDGYRSRSAYKLLEILDKDKLIRPGMTVVDLGAAPRGRSQGLGASGGGAGAFVGRGRRPSRTHAPTGRCAHGVASGASGRASDFCAMSSAPSSSSPSSSERSLPSQVGSGPRSSSLSRAP